MKPGVQKPHWMPPRVTKACWMGCRCWGVPMPSTVMTSLYSGTLLIFLTQERHSSPFRMTVHAPHTPMPQPTFVPVSPSRRITVARVSRLGSHTTGRSTPLMVRWSRS